MKVQFLKIFFVFLAFTALSLQHSFGQDAYAKQMEEYLDLAEGFINESPTKLDSMVSIIFEAAGEKEDKPSLSVAHMYNGIGHAMKSDFGPALQSFQTAWRLAAELNDTMLQVNALTNMAGVYKFVGQSSKAKEKLHKALSLLTGPGRVETRGTTYLALAIVQEEEGDFEGAIGSLRTAMDIFDKAQNLTRYLSCVEQLGQLMEKKGDYNDALKVYRFAMNGRVRAEEAALTIAIYRRMGIAYYKMKNYKEAQTHLETSLTLSDSLAFFLNQDSTLVSLINVSASLGDVEKNNYYTKRLVQFHKMQEAKNVEETLASLETEYLLNEQKLENRVLQAESAQAKSELARNEAIIIGLVVGLLLLISLVAVAIAFYRKVKSFNMQLEIKVAEKTAEVVERNAKLRETSIALAHELRSSVATILGAKSLLDEDGIPEGIDKDLYEAIGYSTEQMDITIKALIQRLDDDISNTKS